MYPVNVSSKRTREFIGLLSSAAARTLFLPSTSCMEWVDLLLFVLAIVGAIFGMLPNTGVRDCFDKDPELLKDDVELLNPEPRKLESILAGEGGLNDRGLSPSSTACMDLRIFV
jgi:hypothetical protein